MSQLTTTTDRPLADRVAATLEDKIETYLAVAPPQMGEGGVRRLIRQAAIAVARNPQLAEATKPSVAIAVLQAVELGIDLAGARPHAWLVPFRNKKGEPEAKLMLSYQGLADIAYREGAVLLIQGRVVYDEDDFEIDYGNAAKPVTHKPALTADGARGKIIGAYALAALPNSPWPAFEWVDAEEIETIRKTSRSKDSDAWQTWYPEMAKKCAVRRLCKLLPTCPPRLDRALTIDREADGLAQAPRGSRAEHKPASGGIESLPQQDGPRLDPRDGQDGPVEITEEDIHF